MTARSKPLVVMIVHLICLWNILYFVDAQHTFSWSLTRGSSSVNLICYVNGAQVGLSGSISLQSGNHVFACSGSNANRGSALGFTGSMTLNGASQTASCSTFKGLRGGATTGWQSDYSHPDSTWVDCAICSGRVWVSLESLRA
jgi:hypothetical protein